MFPLEAIGGIVGELVSDDFDGVTTEIDGLIGIVGDASAMVFLGDFDRSIIVELPFALNAPVLIMEILEPGVGDDIRGEHTSVAIAVVFVSPGDVTEVVGNGHWRS